MSKYIGGTVEQSLGIFEDKLKYMRWERQQRLMIKANQLIEELGLPDPAKELELKYAIPLFEAASLEDDDYMQDLWAKLLINATRSNSNFELNRMYIDILERITPFEAIILKKIYTVSFEDAKHVGIITGGLPNYVEIQDEKGSNTIDIESQELLVALANLNRLGLLSASRTWGGGELFESVNPTLLGKIFIEACTLREEIIVD